MVDALPQRLVPDALREIVDRCCPDSGQQRFDAHLASWAKFSPQTHQSAGKSICKGRSRSNPWLADTLGRIVFANSRADTFLGARYRRLVRHFGKQKALVATGNSILTVL